MKQRKLHPWFFWIAIPTLVLFALLFFFTPPVLERYAMSRAEDAERTVEALSLEISQHSLRYSDYTVQAEGGSFLQVTKSAEAAEFSVKDNPNVRAPGGSILTVAQAEALIEPIWKAVVSELPDGGTMYMLFLPPRMVNDSVPLRRQINMTLSVATGKIAKQEGTVFEQTELGVIQVSAMDQGMTTAIQKNILLIP